MSPGGARHCEPQPLASGCLGCAPGDFLADVSRDAKAARSRLEKADALVFAGPRSWTSRKIPPFALPGHGLVSSPKPGPFGGRHARLWPMFTRLHPALQSFLHREGCTLSQGVTRGGIPLTPHAKRHPRPGRDGVMTALTQVLGGREEGVGAKRVSNAEVCPQANHHPAGQASQPRAA